MSFSSTVDYRYRLVAADLGGRSRTVMVTRVSYQGVENLQPMLHFEGIAKPLALDATQRLVVSQIARSTAVSDWVGLMMDLHPVEHEHRSWIEVTPVGAKRQRAQVADVATPPRGTISKIDNRSKMPRPVQEPKTVAEANESNRRRNATRPSTLVEQGRNPSPSFRLFTADDIPQTSIWIPIALGILLILAFFAVYQLETNDEAWQWLLRWFGLN